MPRRNALFALAGAPLAALLLAACGGSSPSISSARNAADEALDFSRCMREHGVKNFPNPEISEGHSSVRVKVGPGGIEATAQEMEKAQNACKRYREALAPKLTPQEKAENEERVLRFAKCMREHGIKVEASSNGGGFAIRIHGGPGAGRAGGEGGPNPASPAFLQAQKACQGLLPGPKGKLAGGPPGFGQHVGRGPKGSGRETEAAVSAGG